MTRPISATIHSDALCRNLEVVRRHAPTSRILAVIKANGYGHGMLRVAQALQSVDGFAVLNVEEAVALREAGFRQTILLLEGCFDAGDLVLAQRHGITTVVHDEAQLRMLESTQDAVVDVFLKINTGMNRLGVTTPQFPDFYKRLRACNNVREVTLMTHFATADETLGVTDQYAAFERLTAGITAPRSLANSAAVLRYPHTHHEWVRPGIMLYGATPYAGQPAAEFGLQPAMTLQSGIIAIQHLAPGQSLGYGHRFTAEKPTRIGVVACGYADGYPRHAPNGTPIAVAGQMTRTVGRVSMDMLFADLTDIPQADIGSAVELWGAQVPVDAVAEASGTVGYELLCAVAPRVPVRST